MNTIPSAPTQDTPALLSPEAAMSIAPAELQTALSAFTSASRRVEEYYQKLEEEVRRLAGDLEVKNQELERKIVEKDRMQAILISTLQSLTTGVLAVGCDDVVVIANPPACEILEREVGELAGKKVAEALGFLEVEGCPLPSFAGTDLRRYSIEHTRESSAGRRRTIRLSVVPAPAPYDEHLAGLVLVEDVTLLRRLEHQSLVRSRLEGIGEMAMNLAHEIRNPLGSISLFATSLAHELAEDENLGETASHLVSGVNALEHVVENVLEFARSRRVSSARIDLTQVLLESLEFIEHPRKQKSIRLDLKLERPLETSGEEGAWIAGDAEQLKQCFLNIALNAIQAMQEGGTLSVVLRPDVQRGWELAFTDDGIGIPADHIDRIFDPFFTTKEKGSGIGLALVHRILSAHDAQVEVASELKRGTKISIYFPPFIERGEG